MKHLLIIIISVIFINNCISQQKANQPIKGEINLLSKEDVKLIDSLFQDFSGNRPGATVMIAKGDQLLFCKGYGLLNLQDKIPATCDTKYNLASASKQFTALAILQLIDKGKLHFNTTLKEIFPDFPDYGQGITIQHLLTHQSGLVEIEKLPEPQSEKLITDNDRLKQLMKIDSIVFTPGTKYAYNNTEYSVLAEVVRKISGIPFDEYMKKEIFLPAGMTSTNYYPNVNNRNVGYHILQDTIIQAQGMSDATMGSGSVYTSAKDYFKWHLALSNEKLISHQLQQSAYTAQEGTKNQWGHYGYGWVVINNNGYEYIEHGGVTQSAGFVTFTARIPKEKITVAIFTNRAWTQANIPSQNIGIRAKVLLSIASNRSFSMPAMKDIDPKPKKSLAQAFIDDLLSNGMASAKILFEKFKDSEEYYLREAEMNKVGYALINMQRIKDAIAVFQLNIEMFPASWNAYDSLGEVYWADGNKALALKNYEKSVELNPDNTNAVEQIQKIKNE